MITPGTIKEVYIGIVNENGVVGNLHKLADISSVELQEEPEDMDVENWKNFVSVPMTLSFESKIYSNPIALHYFFINGNDLYLRFPKKLRRKKGWKKK